MTRSRWRPASSGLRLPRTGGQLSGPRRPRPCRAGGYPPGQHRRRRGRKRARRRLEAPPRRRPGNRPPPGQRRLSARQPLCVERPQSPRRRQHGRHRRRSRRRRWLHQHGGCWCRCWRRHSRRHLRRLHGCGSVCGFRLRPLWWRFRPKIRTRRPRAGGSHERLRGRQLPGVWKLHSGAEWYLLKMRDLWEHDRV